MSMMECSAEMAGQDGRHEACGEQRRTDNEHPGLGMNRDG